MRRDRPGSGAPFFRGGELLTYIKKGIPYSEVPAAQQGQLEKLHVTIPTTRRQHLTIASAYFPPVSSNYVQPMEDRQTWVDAVEARGPSIICGDFNAHHVSWNEYAQGMPRGVELNNWVEEMRWRCSMTASQQELPGSNKGAVYVLQHHHRQLRGCRPLQLATTH